MRPNPIHARTQRNAMQAHLPNQKAGPTKRERVPTLPVLPRPLITRRKPAATRIAHRYPPPAVADADPTAAGARARGDRHRTQPPRPRPAETASGVLGDWGLGSRAHRRGPGPRAQRVSVAPTAAAVAPAGGSGRRPEIPVSSTTSDLPPSSSVFQALLASSARPAAVRRLPIS